MNVDQQAETSTCLLYNNSCDVFQRSQLSTNTSKLNCFISHLLPFGHYYISFYCFKFPTFTVILINLFNSLLILFYIYC